MRLSLTITVVTWCVMDLLAVHSSAVKGSKNVDKEVSYVAGTLDVDRPAVDDPSTVQHQTSSTGRSSDSESKTIHTVDRLNSPRRATPAARHRSHTIHRLHLHPVRSGAANIDPAVLHGQKNLQDESASALASDHHNETIAGSQLNPGGNLETERAVDDGWISEQTSGSADATKSGIVGEEILPVAQIPELEHLMRGLRAQLRESQSTHMHTRSVINVLQEKQEAQERDMAIMKDELARIKRELTIEKELVRALKAQTSDSAWAIADVKRGQDQVASDLATLKRHQDQQNDTMYVIEELMMSNAVELVSHNKHAVAVRKDIAQLQSDVINDRGNVRALNDLLQRHLVESNAFGSTGSGSSWGASNSIDDFQALPNHLAQPQPPGKGGHHYPAASDHRSGDEDRGSSDETAASDRPGNDNATNGSLKSAERSERRTDGKDIDVLQERLEKFDTNLVHLADRLANIDNRLDSLSASRSQSAQRSTDEGTIAVGAELLQQAFVNFTRHIYGLEEVWRQQALQYNGVEQRTAASSPYDSADTVPPVSHSPTVGALERRLAALNSTLADARRTTESDRSRTESVLAGVDRRLAELAAALAERDERQLYLEILVMNRSVEQCRRANSELAAELRTAQLVEKVAGIEGKMVDQGTAVGRTETALSNLEKQLRRQADSISGLSKQAKLLRHLPPEVSALQADFSKVIAQLPADCASAMQSVSRKTAPDGVYLISTSTDYQASVGRGVHRATVTPSTMRVYCQRDRSDPSTIWTVIQRRIDGKESFTRSWDEYKNGFGDPSGEHWLGNDYISRLTNSASDDPRQLPQQQTTRRYRLRIDMWDVRGRYWTAEYSAFRIRGPDDLYRLELGDDAVTEVDAVASTRRNSVMEPGSGGEMEQQLTAGDGRANGDIGNDGGGGDSASVLFTGNATDSLRYSDRQPFSAIDRDNDVSTTDCARFYAAGWWYKHCHYANLNGRYTSGMVWFNEDLDEWLQMRQTVMKIAPVNAAASASTVPPGAGSRHHHSNDPQPTTVNPLSHVRPPSEESAPVQSVHQQRPHSRASHSGSHNRSNGQQQGLKLTTGGGGGNKNSS